MVREWVADSRIEIDQARLLTLHAAWLMDRYDNKVARAQISAIKIAVPSMASRVIDRAIQVYGGAGVSQDFPLARMYAWQRALRLADGPDESTAEPWAGSSCRSSPPSADGRREPVTPSPAN